MRSSYSSQRADLRVGRMLEAHKSAAISELQLGLVALREKELNFFVWHYSALLVVSGVFLEAALSFVLLGAAAGAIVAAQSAGTRRRSAESRATERALLI